MIDPIFAVDVLEGLSSTPKRLSSRWFYDEIGDELFQQIMSMPEYYLTCAEYWILEHYANEIIHQLPKRFQLLELGAGDGKKTKLLLNEILRSDYSVNYFPIDISENALNKLNASLKIEYPNLNTESIQAEYFTALKSAILNNSEQKLILFLGSNIGNLNYLQSLDFFKQLFDSINPGDFVLTGFDRVKDPEIILQAYNDKNGITAKFNLNLLNRINRELDANFNIDAFYHQPEYDDETQAAVSFLVSKTDQTVNLKKLNKSIEFKSNERIHTEISRKFTLENIQELADNSGFRMIKNYHSQHAEFTDSLWQKPEN
jgi:L-histidine N-alpha-methyltransferase